MGYRVEQIIIAFIYVHFVAGGLWKIDMWGLQILFPEIDAWDIQYSFFFSFPRILETTNEHFLADERKLAFRNL